VIIEHLTRQKNCATGQGRVSLKTTIVSLIKNYYMSEG
jgi:hypothetical protein